MQRALLSLLYMKQTNRWLFDLLCLCNQHLANLRRLLGCKSCDFISVHTEAGGDFSHMLASSDVHTGMC